MLIRSFVNISTVVVFVVTFKNWFRAFSPNEVFAKKVSLNKFSSNQASTDAEGPLVHPSMWTTDGNYCIYRPCQGRIWTLDHCI